MGIIIVHGGIETKMEAPFIAVLREAALSGFRALTRGCLDAAEEAVKMLEKNALFNAGYGSVLNLDGEVEMDASIMDGQSGRFGAVAAISNVMHPVAVARLVLEETSHVLLAGQGAVSFARAKGFHESNCIEPNMLDAWKKAMAAPGKGGGPDVSPFTALPVQAMEAGDTVGCVVSHRGKLAAASSTGGSFLKMPGRVGDTPFPGGGIYASRCCAVVCTGLGEAFIETLTAKYVETLVSGGVHPQAAAEKAISRLTLERGAAGGLVVVDHENRFGAAHNRASFPVVLMVNGQPVDDFTPRKMPRAKG
jgi:beta-aspartyl-peptidase (threonine type)